MRKTHFLFIYLLFGGVLFFSSCLNKQENSPGNSSTCQRNRLDWSRNAVIYEVNIRQYTPEGTFNAFSSHLPRLKKLGIDVLWFMPIHPISVKDRKGSMGSYYAVQDYLKTNPEFGSIDDFKNLVKKAHKMGMKVLIDWVPNHTGRDNVWIQEHPEWFLYENSGEIVVPHDWVDVAKLDYENMEMRQAMIEAMKFWVKECNIDGFRCDVAADVPVDFWEKTSKSLDSIKPMFMLAEAWEPVLVEEAFDMVYGWDFHHIMNEIAKGHKTANEVSEWLIKEKEIYCNDAFIMHFITNHDKNSWNGTEFERMKEAANTFAVLTYTLPGMPLIYTGQEIGLNKRLEFFEKDPITSWKENEYTEFYTQLNKLKHNILLYRQVCSEEN
jgi:glycosidase